MGKNGTVSLGSQVVLAAEILAGRRVGVHVEEGRPLLFFDLRLARVAAQPSEPVGPTVVGLVAELMDALRLVRW